MTNTLRQQMKIFYNYLILTEMKTRFFFAFMLLACASIVVNAQGYKDGIDFYKIGKYDDAQELLERNLDKAETNKAEAYYYLGQVASHKGDITLAKSYFDKGVQANPKYPYNYIGQGAVALEGGNVKVAEELFKMAEKNAAKKEGRSLLPPTMGGFQKKPGGHRKNRGGKH